MLKLLPSRAAAHLDRLLVMFHDDPVQESSHWLWWSAACLGLLMVIVTMLAAGRLTRGATVTIDTKGTVRLGGVLPLRNTAVRDSALAAVSYLNGGTATIAAANTSAFTNVVEMFDAMRKAGITSVTLRAEANLTKQHSDMNAR
jgi:hypothetical protein